MILPLWVSGDWDGLVSLVLDSPVLPSTRPPVDTRTRASRAIERGNLSRGVRILNGPPPAPPADQSVSSRLSAYFPPERGYDAAGPEAVATKTAASLPTPEVLQRSREQFLSYDCILPVVRRSVRRLADSAPGPSGLRGSHLLSCLAVGEGESPLTKQLVRLCQQNLKRNEIQQNYKQSTFGTINVPSSVRVNQQNKNQQCRGQV